MRCRACLANLHRRLSMGDAMQGLVWACAALMALTTLGLVVAIRGSASAHPIPWPPSSEIPPGALAALSPASLWHNT